MSSIYYITINTKVVDIIPSYGTTVSIAYIGVYLEIYTRADGLS